MNAFERMAHRLAAITLLAMTLYAAGARADEPDTPMFSFSGFGTLGVVHSSEDQGGLHLRAASSPTAPATAARGAPTSTACLAAQVTANFTPQLSAVLQVVSEQNYDNTYGRSGVGERQVSRSRRISASVPDGSCCRPFWFPTIARWAMPIRGCARRSRSTTSCPSAATTAWMRAIACISVICTNTVQGRLRQYRTQLPGRQRHYRSEGPVGPVLYGRVRRRYRAPRLSRNQLDHGGFNPLFDGFRQFGPEGVAIADKYDVNDKPVQLHRARRKLRSGRLVRDGRMGTRQRLIPSLATRRLVRERRLPLRQVHALCHLCAGEGGQQLPPTPA